MKLPISQCHLSRDMVHIWRVALTQPAATITQLEQLLSQKERERARRFLFEPDQRRSIISHGALRSILAQYLATAATEIEFITVGREKPALANSPIHFNLSHSGEQALIAVTREREVGIDLEWRERKLDYIDQIAERFFSPREAARFRVLPTAIKPQAFLNCWTRKEAYIKAIGDGLYAPLDQFDVTFYPNESARLLNVDWQQSETKRWRLQELSVGDDYIAAIAVEGFDWDYQIFNFFD